MKSAIRKIGWTVMFGTGFLFGLTTLHYFGNDPSQQFQPEVYLNLTVLLRVHIALGIIALLAGPFLFLANLRNRRPSLHRNLGKVYIVSVLVSSIGGLWLSQIAFGGAIAKLGFGTLAMLWLVSTCQAYSKIRARDVVAHRDWMIRSYALTFAFVTFRLWLPFLEYACGLPNEIAYGVGSWLCWGVNLAIYEVYRSRVKDNSERERIYS